jgi:uncharacterized repeat protein (TIGR01451 family)
MSNADRRTRSCPIRRGRVSIRVALFSLSSCLALLVLLAGPGALAAQTTAMSSAYGESVSLHVLPLLGGGVTVASGPLPLVAGTAPPAFDHSGSLASITVSSALTGRILATRLLAVHASSALPGADAVAADATVDNLALDVVGHLPLLTLGADVVRSTASLAGTCADGPVLVGTTALVNARASGALGLGLAISAAPAPNTVLLNVLGLRVVLNEQIPSSAAGFAGLTVNAIHVSLNALPVAGLGIVTGDVILSQSHAEIHCVRESADLSLAMSGFPDPVSQGGTLFYSLTVTNAGPDAAAQVVLTDPLPPGVTFLAANPSQGTCSGTATITCDLGTLQPGDQAVIAIDVRADQLGLVTNTATVSSATPDPNLADNQATVTNLVQNGGR